MTTKMSCCVHGEQPLDLICLASNCHTKGLLCYLCKIEQHKQHSPILSVKIFLHSFLASRSINQVFVRQTSQIDEELLFIQRKLLKLKNKFQDYGIVQESYGRFWKQTVEEITEYDSILSELQNIMLDKSDNQQKLLNTWILKYSDMFQPEKEEEQKDSVYVTYLKGKLASLKAITAVIEKYQQKTGFEDADILCLFKISTSMPRIKLHFSQSLKGTCMTIHSPTKASMQTSGNQRMILLQPALSTSRSLKKWKVKIQKLASWIGVGVSHLDSVKAVNFDFSYTNANHGNYLISSNGYSWNGYKMEFNSKYQPFQYTTGDIIQVTYDPVNNKITFQKENHDQIFSYDIDPTQKPIHAAINMTGIGDCVEILL